MNGELKCNNGKVFQSVNWTYPPEWCLSVSGSVLLRCLRCEAEPVRENSLPMVSAEVHLTEEERAETIPSGLGEYAL